MDNNSNSNKIIVLLSLILVLVIASSVGIIIYLLNENNKSKNNENIPQTNENNIQSNTNTNETNDNNVQTNTNTTVENNKLPEWATYLLNKNGKTEFTYCVDTYKSAKVTLTNNDLKDILNELTSYELTKYYYGGMGSGGCFSELKVTYDNDEYFKLNFSKFIETNDNNILAKLEKEKYKKELDNYCKENTCEDYSFVYSWNMSYLDKYAK